jgi:hypothetical protein
MAMQRLGSVCVGLAIVLAGVASRGAMAEEAKGGELVRFVAPDFCAAIVIHPERIAKTPLANAIKSVMPKQKDETSDVAALLTTLNTQGQLPPGMNVEQLTKLLEGKKAHRVIVLVDPMPAADVPASPGLIVQFSTDVDGEAILSAASKEWKPADTKGIKYQKMKSPEAGKPDIAASVVDARTIVFGLESTVVKMLAKSQGSSPLLNRLRKADLNNDIIVEVVAETALKKIAKSTGKSIEEALADLAPQAVMAKDVKSFSATINYSGKTLLHAELVTTKEESAGTLGMLATMGISAGKEKLAEFKKDPPPLPPKALKPLTKLCEEVLGSLKVKNDGPRLVIDLPMPASLPDAIKAMGELAKDMPAPPAPPAKKDKKDKK